MKNKGEMVDSRIWPLAIKVFCLIAVAWSPAFSAASAELILSFPKVVDRGVVVYAVFASEPEWRSKVSPVSGSSSPIFGGSAEIVLDLPPGRYAVMAYHDRDADGRLDTLPIGLPTEPYGFSNNARGAFGPPPFSAAAFEVVAQGARQTIRLR